MRTLKIGYNIKQEGLRDITPETMADTQGKLQSDHNEENSIARIRLDGVEKYSINNRAKISELEKLSIKHQTEIDFIKNTPTRFDLAATELFVNEYNTLKTAIPDNMPDSDILTTSFATREDGNFEYGLLKNPRAKYYGAVDKAVNLQSLFGSSIKDVHYGEKSASLWILTSDGIGNKGYIYRCSDSFIDGELNILQYWIIESPGANFEYNGIAEFFFNGESYLLVAVSEEGAGSGHYLNKYHLSISNGSVLITDGKEQSPGVARYKDTGEILDGELSSSTFTNLVETASLTVNGDLRGIDIVNNKIFVAVKEFNNTDENFDSKGYSLIFRCLITTSGISTSSINTKIYKLDEILEDFINEDKSAGGSDIYDIYGIAAKKSNDLNFVNIDQSELDSIYSQNDESYQLFVAAKNRSTGRKKIVLIDTKGLDTKGSNDYYFKSNISKLEMGSYTGEDSYPFIATNVNNNVYEICETPTRKILAVHETFGYDIFQGTEKYTLKTKKYYDSENHHAQLLVRTKSVSLNKNNMFYVSPDQAHTIKLSGGEIRVRTPNSGDILNICSYYSGIPYTARPDKTVMLYKDSSNVLSGVSSVTINGDVNSGTVLYIAHKEGSSYLMRSASMIDINATVAQNGDAAGNYGTITTSSITIASGDLGAFNGSVAFDQITGKLWVSTDRGFVVNIPEGSVTLSAGSVDNYFRAVKHYGDVESEDATDGSHIIAITAYDGKLYVATYVPDGVSADPVNTIVRVFDSVRSTFSQPFSTDMFVINGIVRDMAANDSGLFATIVGDISDYTNTARSSIRCVYTKQFDNDVFESTEVFDEFNFFANEGTGNSNPSYEVTAAKFFERDNDTSKYRDLEWCLPRRGMIFALKSKSSLSPLHGKLQIVDYSNIDRPAMWAEFNITKDNSPSIPPWLAGVSGALLHGSGQINDLTFIDDRLFVARENSGYGVTVNVIDFLRNNAYIIVDPVGGSGSVMTGMQFGYKDLLEDKTGNLNERNNASFHYSGFVNSNIKVGSGRITCMDSAFITNKINENVLTPYVIVGRERTVSNGHGGVDIINARTLESIVNIGPNRGDVKKVVLNPDGSAFVAINNPTNSGSATIWKINDIRLISNDNDNYIEDFAAQRVNIYYPDAASAINITDMKVYHYTNTLGEKNNIIYTSFADNISGSVGRTGAVRFNYETIAMAGDGSGEFLNNAEFIFTSKSTNNLISSIDFMDDRVMLAFKNAGTEYNFVVLKQIPAETSPAGYANKWIPILGDDGTASFNKTIGYQDLHYNGIKSNINRIDSVRELSLVFNMTERGVVVNKFPFITRSKWLSTPKNVNYNTTAVAIARDVYVDEGYITEIIDRNDESLVFDGNWQESASGEIVNYSAPLFDRATGKKQIGGKLLTSSGSPYNSNTYYDFKPFDVAKNNGFFVYVDGVNIEELGYDYNDNVLMIAKDKPLQVIDIFDLNSYNYKNNFIDKKFATVSLNDENSTLSFYKTESGTLYNSGSTDYSGIVVNADVSQSPVVVVTAFGKQLAAFTNNEGIDNPSLDNVQSPLTITGASGEVIPVNKIIVKAKSNKSVSKVSVSTYNVKLTERLYNI